MRRSILVISGEKSINKAIVDNFVNSLTTVVCTQTSLQALEMIIRDIYSLIIVDSFIKDMDRGVLLQIIRRLTDVPILVLTHQEEIEDRIGILDMGADDCLIWPANIDDLILRVEACMKRGTSLSGAKPVMFRKIGLIINPGRRYVELEKKEIILTKREFDILYLLASNPGVVFSKEQIYAIIWGEQFIKDDSNIMSHIGRLRKKIGEAGRYIQTVWGIGYRFADSEQIKE